MTVTIRYKMQVQERLQICRRVIGSRAGPHPLADWRSRRIGSFGGLLHDWILPGLMDRRDPVETVQGYRQERRAAWRYESLEFVQTSGQYYVYHPSYPGMAQDYGSSYPSTAQDAPATDLWVGGVAQYYGSSYPSTAQDAPATAHTPATAQDASATDQDISLPPPDSLKTYALFTCESQRSTTGCCTIAFPIVVTVENEKYTDFVFKGFSVWGKLARHRVQFQLMVKDSVSPYHWNLLALEESKEFQLRRKKLSYDFEQAENTLALYTCNFSLEKQLVCVDPDWETEAAMENL
ncbi:hypothetical protein LA080_011832 [Diaporthe eres]|nr:hypothetical protein LA080_011832 [Diaporthe eres]